MCCYGHNFLGGGPKEEQVSRVRARACQALQDIRPVIHEVRDAVQLAYGPFLWSLETKVGVLTEKSRTPPKICRRQPRY